MFNGKIRIIIALVFVALVNLYKLEFLYEKMNDLRNGEDENSFKWLYSHLDHPCKNSTLTGYELPSLPTQPNCPNQYLLFHTIGQFNNVLICFVKALIYAAATNRTVILNHYKYNFTHLLNWTNLCAVEMTHDQITRLYQQTQYPKPIPFLHWGGVSTRCQSRVRSPSFCKIFVSGISL